MPASGTQAQRDLEVSNPPKEVDGMKTKVKQATVHGKNRRRVILTPKGHSTIGAKKIKAAVKAVVKKSKAA